uniref:Uncharacterized protein n=1 Tax=Rhizophora mucronata TaxID=61149 RepID=A0A2P2QB70_RHIMU
MVIKLKKVLPATKPIALLNIKSVEELIRQGYD